MFEKAETRPTRPVIAYRDVHLSRLGSVQIQYFEFPSKEDVTNPNYHPRRPVASVQITGPTANHVLDTAADSIYQRARDIVLRGITGKLTKREAQDVRGIERLRKAIEGAKHLG